MPRRFVIPDAVLWLWVLLVGAYFAWSVHTYSGLFRILSEWQIANWGRYNFRVSAIFPGFLLAGPALAILGRRARRRQAVEDLYDPTRKTVRARRWLLRLCLLSLIVSAGAYWWSTTLLDRSGPVMALDLGILGKSAPPPGPVTLHGEAQGPLAQHYEAIFEGISQVNNFVPLAAPGGGTGPIRFILMTNADAYLANAPGTLPQVHFLDGRDAASFPMTTATGVLVANDLPGPVLARFERAGVALADPYYVLNLTPEGSRGPYWAIAAVAAFVAFLLLIVAGAQTILIWRLRRRHPELRRRR